MCHLHLMDICICLCMNKKRYYIEIAKKINFNCIVREREINGDTKFYTLVCALITLMQSREFTELLVRKWLFAKSEFTQQTFFFTF